MTELALSERAAAVLEAARAAGVRLATAESCTGGLISAALTDIPGSSDVFECGFVTYSNAAKSAILKVDPQLIATHGAVSEAVAAAMVRGAVAASRADLAVSVTGVAGPGGGTARKPEGMVCFGGLGPGRPPVTETVQFGPQGRDAVRRLSVMHALEMLARMLALPG